MITQSTPLTHWLKKIGTVASGALLVAGAFLFTPSFIAQAQTGTSTSPSATSTAPWAWNGTNWAWTGTTTPCMSSGTASTTCPWGTNGTSTIWTWNGTSTPWSTGTSTATSTNATSTMPWTWNNWSWNGFYWVWIGSTPGTTTSTTTDETSPSNLLALIRALQARVAILEARLQALLNSWMNGGGNNSTSGPMSLSPTSATIRAGQTLDFRGSNFPHEEDISIYQGTTLIGRAHADGGGNFTTGSITIPSTPGIYTYSFVGSPSNAQMTSTITVQ